MQPPAIVTLFSGPEHEPFLLEGSGLAGALLIHGFPGTPGEMRPLGLALAEAGVSAHGLLLPGFGPQIARLHETGADDWVRAARLAWRDVRASYEHRVLVGFSMGGAIALTLAAEAPPTRLVLLAPFWHLLGPGWPLGYLLPAVGRLLPSFAPFARVDFADPGVRATLTLFAGDADLTDPAVQALFRQHARVHTATIREVWSLGLRSGPAARQVAAPTLIIQGDRDRTIALRETRALARLFPVPPRLEIVQDDHQIVSARGPEWPRVRDLVRSFILEATE